LVNIPPKLAVLISIVGLISLIVVLKSDFGKRFFGGNKIE